MALTYHTVDQRSPEWYALRAGKLTGSSAKDMLARIKTGEAAKRRDLRYKLAAERLTGTSQENGYINDVMQWGIDHEANAVAAYEALVETMVAPVGFIELNGREVGTSPDGLIGEDGLLSVKCPKTATHLSYIKEGLEPEEHWAQNTHELWLTGRSYLDFVSFDPRLPEDLQLWTVRVTRSDADLSRYGEEVEAFLRDVDLTISDIRRFQQARRGAR